ncbi:bifunctional nuclease family protein [Chloroflexus sp.]|uniref:bifunctional nuclease family protein n=1 Tax=Chloroflexus sp. TaxID=1904827 RepID=UPI002ADE3B74|nr:bifunctional nuclease family protein [Chloroflexus sp.]
MIRVVVDSIRVSLLTQSRVVVLRETEGNRYLPIWIGQFEADAIAMAIQGHEPQRPMTHDLLKAAISELDGLVRQIYISDIRDNTFFARILIDQAGRTVELDARPSDAIALAERVQAPIFVAAHVLDQAGVLFDEEEQSDDGVPPTPVSRNEEPESEASSEPEPELNEDSLSIFRNFINTLDLNDRDRPGEKS